MPSRTTAMQKQIYDFFLNCNGKFVFSALPAAPDRWDAARRVSAGGTPALHLGMPRLYGMGTSRYAAKKYLFQTPVRQAPSTALVISKLYSIHILLI